MKIQQEKAFAIIRIIFGFVWGIDAAFKWTPSFLNGLPGMIGSMISGQPVLVADWLGFWLNIVNFVPLFSAVIIAIIETSLALSLVFNILPRLTYVFGFVFALLIWGVGEAFGGPYTSGSTDIGAAVIYAFVFAMLYFQKFGNNLESRSNTATNEK